MCDEKALIKVDDLAGFSKPADTLIKKISKAVGGLYLPRQIRRVASAKADATIIEANADAEVEKSSPIVSVDCCSLGFLVADRQLA